MIVVIDKFYETKNRIYTVARVRENREKETFY